MRFLIDEMFPSTIAAMLTERGHDAVHARTHGLTACPDAEVADAARRAGRTLVTENVKDFAAERELIVVCVLKARAGGGGATRLALRVTDLLDDWAVKNPEPYLGSHWPP